MKKQKKKEVPHFLAKGQVILYPKGIIEFKCKNLSDSRRFVAAYKEKIETAVRLTTQEAVEQARLNFLQDLATFIEENI